MQKFYVCNNDSNNIVYKIDKAIDNKLILVGVNYRSVISISSEMIREATKDDIKKEEIKNDKYKKVAKKATLRNNKVILGSVLHLDGDLEYLKKCMELYKSIGVHAWGKEMKEESFEEHIITILNQVTPDVIVITGHDSFNGKDKKDIENYKNTKNFLNSISKIRKMGYSGYIIAGACQSNFEALMASGATFASSPDRINVHTYDPAIIAIKICTTSTFDQVDFDDALKYIEGRKKAYNGIRVYGKMKILY